MRRLCQGIYRFYYFKTMNRELSENLTSEVFIRVYKNIRKTNLNRRSFAVWIYRIANNILIDHFKKKNRSYEPIENVIDSIHVNDKEVLKQNSSYLRSKLGIENKELMSALDILTGLQKDIIILRFVEDFYYETIAKIYKKTKGTVRGIVFRAIERLRKEMTKVNL
jgi:RNA polymerase sigma-70 factor, ECF subfamily